MSRLPPRLVVITPRTNAMNRYVGKDRTHKCVLDVPIDGRDYALIHQFRTAPDSVVRPDPNTPKPPYDPWSYDYPGIP